MRSRFRILLCQKATQGRTQAYGSFAPPTFRFSSGVERRPLQPVVMLRMHATRPIRKKPEPEWLPCAPRSSTSLRHSRHGDDDLALVIAGAKEPKGFRQIG